MIMLQEERLQAFNGGMSTMPSFVSYANSDDVESGKLNVFLPFSVSDTKARTPQTCKRKKRINKLSIRFKFPAT